jgi:predicted tellurium resistance membrane protein TerC
VHVSALVWAVTLVALIGIFAVDLLIFALDSIPAVFGLTTQPPSSGRRTSRSGCRWS